MSDIAYTPEFNAATPVSLLAPVDAPAPVFPVPVAAPAHVFPAPAPVFPAPLAVYADEYVVSLDNGHYLVADGHETVTEVDRAQVFRKRSAVASAVRSYRRGAKRLGFDPAVVNVLHRQKLVTQFVTYAGEIHLDSH
jgi:hypothetical protein